MSTITSLGVGSGLDIKSIVSDLVAAERKPKASRLDRQEVDLQTQLSAYGALKGALSDFRSSAASLKSSTAFNQRTVESSDSAVVKASATSAADPGEYDIEVSKLAQSHKLASGTFDSTTEAVGTGTLTFRFGTYDSDANTFTANAERSIGSVEIGASDNSLEGIRDAVNSADIGVKANIVDDGSGYRLLFKSEHSGAANSLEVTTADADDDHTDKSGLSQLAYDPTGTKNLEQTVAAQDATFTIDGLSMKRDSNSVVGAIGGVTLDLRDVTSGSAETITVANDKSSVKKGIESFVKSYNGVMEMVSSTSSYNAETEEGGVLLGDATVRGITSQLRRGLAEVVDDLSGPYRALSDIGITTNSSGKLNIDSSKLDEALSENFDEVGRLFAAVGKSNDSLVDYSDSTDSTKAGEYGVTIDQLATRGSHVGGDISTSFPLTIDASNDVFKIKVDGTQSGTIELTQKTYDTGGDLAAELQSRINGDDNLKDAGASVSVNYETDHLEIVSARYGSESKVTITSSDAGFDTDLKLGTNGIGTEGVDVSGQIGGVDATGSGQYLTGAGDASGLKLMIAGGSTGDRGTVEFTRGVSDRLTDTLDRYLDSNGLINAKTDGIQNRIEGIGEARADLAERLEKYEQRMLDKFIAMDMMVSQFNSIQDRLTQQLATLQYGGKKNF